MPTSADVGRPPALDEHVGPAVHRVRGHPVKDGKRLPGQREPDRRARLRDGECPCPCRLVGVRGAHDVAVGHRLAAPRAARSAGASARPPRARSSRGSRRRWTAGASGRPAASRRACSREKMRKVAPKARNPWRLRPLTTAPIPCSRTPKWRLRPAYACGLDVAPPPPSGYWWRARGRRSRPRARAAARPTGCRPSEALRVAIGLSSDSQLGVPSQPRAATPPLSCAAAPTRRGALPGRRRLALPLALPGAALDALSEAGEPSSGIRNSGVGGPAVDLLGQAHLLLAERRAVGLPGVLAVGRPKRSGSGRSRARAGRPPPCAARVARLEAIEPQVLAPGSGRASRRPRSACPRPPTWRAPCRPRWRCGCRRRRRSAGRAPGGPRASRTRVHPFLMSPSRADERVVVDHLVPAGGSSGRRACARPGRARRRWRSPGRAVQLWSRRPARDRARGARPWAADLPEVFIVERDAVPREVQNRVSSIEACPAESTKRSRLDTPVPPGCTSSSRV